MIKNVNFVLRSVLYSHLSKVKNQENVFFKKCQEIRMFCFDFVCINWNLICFDEMPRFASINQFECFLLNDVSIGLKSPSPPPCIFFPFSNSSLPHWPFSSETSWLHSTQDYHGCKQSKYIKIYIQWEKCFFLKLLSQWYCSSWKSWNEWIITIIVCNTSKQLSFFWPSSRGSLRHNWVRRRAAGQGTFFRLWAFLTGSQIYKFSKFVSDRIFW